MVKTFVIQDSNSLNGFELTNLDYYIGKAGRLLIRVGDPISYLNQFVLLSYQNRDINKGCLFINLTTTNRCVADSPVIVYFNSSGIITKIGLYL